MLTPQDWRRHVWWPGLAFAFALSCVTFGELDMPIAHALFYSDATWLGAGAGDWWAHTLLHGGGRWLVRGVAATAAVYWLLSRAYTPLAGWRREALFVFAGIIATVALVGTLKSLTNVDCPWDLAGFGGTRPYVALLGDRPDYLPRARCFPGAHSSSGFALLALYFALRDRARPAARVALVAGISIGAAFAVGQEARGAHFLSHDLASAALVWLALVWLYSRMLARRASTDRGGPACTQPCR